MREPTWCRFCESQNITPVKFIKPHGKKTQISYRCPVCGQLLSVSWKAKKKEAQHGRTHQPTFFAGRY